MSWLCKSCGCENSSQSNVCCNCGETNKKIILSKNNNDSVKLNKSTNRHQVESNVNNSQNRGSQGVQNSQHSVKSQNRGSQRVQNSQHSVNTQNRGTQRVQSPQVHNSNRNVNTSVAENRRKTEDLILKIVLIVGSMFIIVLLIIFLLLLRRNNNNNNNNSFMVDSSQDTNITLNTYSEEDITDIETTIYTTITDEPVTTTESTTDTTTETTIESTIPVTTVQESAVVLTVAPTDATTRPIETAPVTVETTSKPIDDHVGHAYSPNFVTYYNGRFMYSVKYPDNFYTSFESDNGDGCELTDGCATIRLYSRYNIDNDSSRTAHDYAVSNINQDMYYELVKDDFYIISWVENGNVMYRKVFVNDRITTLEFEYSTEYKNIYDKMITEMVLTFSVD